MARRMIEGELLSTPPTAPTKPSRKRKSGQKPGKPPDFSAEIPSATLLLGRGAPFEARATYALRFTGSRSAAV